MPPPLSLVVFRSRELVGVVIREVEHTIVSVRVLGKADSKSKKA
jgi:hypothetical protein